MGNFSRQAILMVICAFAVLGGLAVPGYAGTPDWNQYQHDAAHSGRNPNAIGPIWPRVVPGWPVDCPDCFAIGGAGPIVSKVVLPDGESTTGVFSGTSNERHKVYGFDSRGRTLPGWPVDVNQGWGGTRGYPAIGTAEGRRAIFAVDRGPRLAQLYGVGINGELLGGSWPWTAGPDPYASAYYGPTLATDSNGEQTIYVRVQAGSSENFLIYALDSSGAVKRGWPADSGSGESGWFSPAPDSPIVAPDGSVYAKSAEGPYGDERSGKLLGFMPSGDPKPGWPFRFPNGQRLRSTNPAAGDNNTVYVATNYSADSGQPNWLTTLRGYLYAFSPAGRVKAGWPREVPGMAFGTPAIAADGTVYFLVARPISTAPENDAGVLIHVYAFSERGEPKPGWPKKVHTCDSGPMSAPVFWGLALDRAGNVFVPGGTNNVLCNEGSEDDRTALLHGFSPRGRSLPGWPLRLPNGSPLLTPALGNDGVLYALGASEDSLQLYAIRSGKRPRRCDPRLSARRCPPRLIKGSVGKLRAVGKGRR